MASRSKKFRDSFGHTPLSLEEEIPWNFQRGEPVGMYDE
jgi:hypothetical protein